MFIRIYIYDIFGSESISSIPDNWTFWQRDNVCGTMATPVDLVHVHTVLYSKGGRQTRETNGMLCNKQSTSWVTDFHNFPHLQRRDFMVFSYDHILSPWIISILSPYFHIFPIQKSLKDSSYAFLRHRSTSAFSSFVSHVRQRDGLADGPGIKSPLGFLWGHNRATCPFTGFIWDLYDLYNLWNTIWLWLTVRHGKSLNYRRRFRSLGKSSISIRAIYTMAM
jgi:hypothetical protein